MPTMCSGRTGSFCNNLYKHVMDGRTDGREDTKKLNHKFDFLSYTEDRGFPTFSRSKATLLEGVSICQSVRPSGFRSRFCFLAFYERHTCYAPKSTRRGDGRRNRPAARVRTSIIDPRRHLLNTIRRRGNRKSESKQHSRSKQRYSRYAGAILDTLTPFLMRRHHSATYLRKICGIFSKRRVIDL